jgi:hypothetical protein
MKYVYVDLAQGMRRTQTRATTRSEQTMMVPIEAPPFIGLRVNYNIFDGTRCDGIQLQQGFPILKDRTAASQQQLDGLLKMSIEVASLSSDIAYTKAIHQA